MSEKSRQAALLHSGMGSYQSDGFCGCQCWLGCRWYWGDKRYLPPRDNFSLWIWFWADLWPFVHAGDDTNSTSTPFSRRLDFSHPSWIAPLPDWVGSVRPCQQGRMAPPRHLYHLRLNCKSAGLQRRLSTVFLSIVVPMWLVWISALRCYNKGE